LPTQTTDLFRLEELADAGRTSELAESDREALRAVADWIQSFVVRPNENLGRAGPVCPFVPESLDRQVLWLAPEHVADGGAQDVVQLMNGYKSLFLGTKPTEDADA
jgi:hypothetical protein